MLEARNRRLGSARPPAPAGKRADLRVVSVAGSLAALLLCGIAPGETDAAPSDEFRGEPLIRIVETVSADATPRPAVDPEVAWERATVFTRGRPGSEVRRNLAELFDYEWVDRKDPSGEKKPVLSAGGRSRGREERLRQREFQLGVAQLGVLAGYANHSPEYYRQLRERLAGKEPDDPILRLPRVLDRLADPSTHAAIALLGTLSTGQLPRVDRRTDCFTPVYLPWREMTSQQRALSLRAVSTRQLSDSDEDGLLKEFGLLLRPSFDVGPVFSDYFFLVSRPREAVSNLRNGLTRPQEAFSARGCPYRSAVTPPPRQKRNSLTGKGNSGYEALEAKPFPARGFRQSYPARWDEILDQISTRLEMPIYSDYFPQKLIGVDPRMFEGNSEGFDNPAVLPLEKLNVAEALDALCGRFGRIWWTEHGALYFRNRQWYWDVLYQVPEPVLAPIREELVSGGKLSVASIDRLCGLTVRQAEGLGVLAEHELRMQVPWNNQQGAMWRLLRVWRLLSPAEKLRAVGEGLSAEQLKAGRWRVYREELFQMRASKWVLVSPPPFRLTQRVTRGTAPTRSNPGRPSFVDLQMEVWEAGRTSSEANIRITFPVSSGGR